MAGDANAGDANAGDAMLLISLVIGLALGVAAGGNILNLASVRMRLLQLLFLGLVVRYATQYAIELGITEADANRLFLFGLGFLLLLIGLWVNREQPERVMPWRIDDGPTYLVDGEATVSEPAGE